MTNNRQISVLDRITIVEREVNRLYRRLKNTPNSWENQHKVLNLSDQLDVVCANLARLYEERDAAIVAAKLEELKVKVADRSALTATGVSLKMIDSGKPVKNRSAKPSRPTREAEELSPGRPVKIGAKGKSSKRRDKSLVA